MKRTSNAQIVSELPKSLRSRFIRDLKREAPREFDLMKKELAEMKAKRRQT